MDRIATTEKMIPYLEEHINCDNIKKYHDKFYESTINDHIDKLLIKNKPVSYTVLPYDTKNSEWKEKLFFRYDFMTEADYTGSPYFPYLYGVLDCYDKSEGE